MGKNSTRRSGSATRNRLLTVGTAIGLVAGLSACSQSATAVAPSPSITWTAASGTPSAISPSPSATDTPSPSATASASVSPSPSSPSPSATRIKLTSAGLGTLAAGAAGSKVEALLTSTLGKPSSSEVTQVACEINPHAYPPRKTLTWGKFSVVLDRAESGGYVLRGWSVDGAVPAALALPYGVTTATPVSRALTMIPGATSSWDDTMSFLNISTRQAKNVVWGGRNKTPTGTISFITNDFSPCE